MIARGLRAQIADSAFVVLATTVPATGSVNAETWQCLSSQEQRRLASMNGPARRAEFATGRALLRRSLAPLFGVAPPDVPLAITTLGRPYLTAPLPGAAEISVSLSHSCEHLAVALSQHGDVGVDLELIRPYPRRLEHRCCTTAERAGLERVPPERRAAAFHHLWTVKEACAKATGEGLRQPLSQVVGSLGRSGDWAGIRWHALELFPCFATAVALRVAGSAPPPGWRIHVTSPAGVAHARRATRPR